MRPLPLVEVRVFCSGISPLPKEICWSWLRDFERIGDVFNASRLPPAAHTELLVRYHLYGPSYGNFSQADALCVQADSTDHKIGCLRQAGWADQCWIEQLTGLDDRAFYISWRLVSHELNRNPFPASFVNYRASMQLLTVTLGNQTWASYETTFETEADQAHMMHRTFTDMGNRLLIGLQNLPSTPPSSSAGPEAAPKVPRPIGGGALVPLPTLHETGQHGMLPALEPFPYFRQQPRSGPLPHGAAQGHASSFAGGIPALHGAGWAEAPRGWPHAPQAGQLPGFLQQQASHASFSQAQAVPGSLHSGSSEQLAAAFQRQSLGSAAPQNGQGTRAPSTHRPGDPQGVQALGKGVGQLGPVQLANSL